jgi:hypothetical protein
VASSNHMRRDRSSANCGEEVWSAGCESGSPFRTRKGVGGYARVRATEEATPFVASLRFPLSSRERVRGCGRRYSKQSEPPPTRDRLEADVPVAAIDPAFALWIFGSSDLRPSSCCHALAGWKPALHGCCHRGAAVPPLTPSPNPSPLPRTSSRSRRGIAPRRPCA